VVQFTVLFLQAPQPLTPIIVRVIESPSKEISVADVLLGSIGITGLFLLGALLFGFLLGGAFILFGRWRERRDPDSSQIDAFHLTQPPRTRV
jgi:hypothetical protein